MINDDISSWAARRGERNNALLAISRKCRNAGLSAGETESLLAEYACDMGAEIARAVAKVYETDLGTLPQHTKKLTPEPCDFVFRMLDAGRDYELPPVAQDIKEQRTTFLKALFRPGDIIAHCTVDSDIRKFRLLKYEEAVATMTVQAEHVLMNPVDGKKHTVKDGTRLSYISEACITYYRNFLVEFDEGLNYNEQLQLWKGIIATAALPVVCLVYSGGKSIHATVRSGIDEPAGEAALARWKQGGTELAHLFTADVALHCDYGVLASPCRRVRMAGAYRADKRKTQSLLYVCPQG